MGLWESFKNIMTIPDEDDYDDDVAYEESSKDKGYEEQPKKEPPKIIKGKNTAQQPNKPQMQVVLVKPDRFEDVTSIADHLNDRKTVVLNLETSNRETSRRILDFLSGVAYANHGNIKKVANNTFMIVAYNVDIMGEVSLDDYEDGKLYF